MGLLKYIISLIFICLAVLLTGCIEEQNSTRASTPTPVPTLTPIPIPAPVTPVSTLTGTPLATEIPVPEILPTGKKILIKIDGQRGFIPNTLVITTGDEIIWENSDTVTITLISDDMLFDSRILVYDKRYNYLFKTPGNYSFHVENVTNLTCTIAVESQVAVLASTPAVTTLQELPPGALYVIAQMLRPLYWKPGNYSLESLKVQIFNQRNIQMSIKAQILNGERFLEEKSFTLEKDGSNYQFSTDRRHFINSTDVTLRLLVQGYQPVEYKFIEVNSLN